MKNIQSTYSSNELGSKMADLNIEDLKSMAVKTTIGNDTKYTKGRFERFMNRIGWYRKSEWYLIDSSKFMTWPTFKSPEIK